MRTRVLAVAIMLIGCGAQIARAADDGLARARQLYNDRRFEAAVLAAEEARSTERGDAIDLVVARASLERYRESDSDDDLQTARARLGRINPTRLTDEERTEYLVGLGEALYLNDAAGAAANVFDTIFEASQTIALPAAARERVLDWWATALDREARPRSDIDRQPVYSRIRDRMRQEIGLNPSSGVAAYWLSAAAVGLGDFKAAWDAALAAWVRSPLTDERGGPLREQIDQLMIQLIAPQRARSLAQPTELLLQQWDDFKSQWAH